MFTFIAAAALTAVNPAPVTTIVIDNSAICGMGRIADGKRQQAESTARKVARELRAEGKTVRIVRVDGAIDYTAMRGPVIRMAGC